MPNSPIVGVMYRVGASAALLGLVLGGCGERPAPADGQRPPPAIPAAQVLRLEPPAPDVAMLQLQPDGSYRRVCRAPSPEVRAMLDGVRQARRARR
jgi:hypothetical protein